MTPAASNSPIALLGGLMILAFVFGMYLLPALIASHRKHRQIGPIWIVNIFLGWTMLGWIGCLAWALSTPSAPQVIYVERAPSGLDRI